MDSQDKKSQGFVVQKREGGRRRTDSQTERMYGITVGRKADEKWNILTYSDSDSLEHILLWLTFAQYAVLSQDVAMTGEWVLRTNNTKTRSFAISDGSWLNKVHMH